MMINSRVFTRMWAVLGVCSALTYSPVYVLSQSPQKTNPIEQYFHDLPTAVGVGGNRGEPAYLKLMDSIGTMTPTEITAGLTVIDQQIDSTVQPPDLLAKVNAATLLMLISWRPDGPELLASEMDRLTSMLNDPSHLLSGPAAATFEYIGVRRPKLVWPVLETALEDPQVNNATGIGPRIAGILLFMGPHGDDVTEHIVKYMRRPDLTNSQLLATILGINASPVIPAILTNELIQCLDLPDENIKTRALVGIARSTPSAKSAAQSRLQKMANDTRETAHIRHLAAEALQGEITHPPELDK